MSGARTSQVAPRGTPPANRSSSDGTPVCNKGRDVEGEDVVPAGGAGVLAATRRVKDGIPLQIYERAIVHRLSEVVAVNVPSEQVVVAEKVS